MGVLFFKAIPRSAIWGHTKLNGRGDLQDRSVLAISLGMMIFLKE